MTREEIMAMEAGTGMDALVAEKIMGMELARPLGEHFVTHDMAMDAGDMSLEGQSMGVEWEQIQPPPFSTDISYAWEVVVKMENDDYWWMADDVVPNSDPVVYHWKFYKGKNQYHSDYEYSISLAICRAALIAVIERE